MILCKKAEGTDGYFVQGSGSEVEVMMEVLHLIRSVYDNMDEKNKERFRSCITAAVTGGAEGNIWDAPAEATSINLSPLHRRGDM